MDKELVAKPPHVPQHLVVDFDFREPPGVERDVHAAWDTLHKLPPMVWTPFYGGHWIATRAELIERVQKESATFSHANGVSMPRGVKPVRYLPLEADPPEQETYRKIINPSVGPIKLRTLREQVRAISVDLIENLKPLGKCDFKADFSRIVPITVFLGMVDLPLTQRDTFLKWVDNAVYGASVEIRVRAFADIGEYLAAQIAIRRAEPGEDLLSMIASAKVDGRAVSDAEALGMASNVFIGGLDTVMNMMAFFMLHLARHPEDRQALVSDSSLIPNAVEELLRRYSITCTSRTVLHDLEFGGVQLMKGDIVMTTPTLHGLDDTRFPDPLKVDFTRSNRRHASFGNGPHMCMGAGLARIELNVLLEEWLSRIPDFSLAPGAEPTCTSGNILSVQTVPLVWST